MGQSGKNKINIGIITTSRADWGIYLPLLRKIKQDSAFNLYIFAGGMHTDGRFGRSYKLIEQDGFTITEKVSSLVNGYEPSHIALSIAKTAEKFSLVWNKYHHRIDYLFALGDRYEMFAACAASVPFNMTLVHLHGGETTLGATDNIFRHAITSMSTLHFVSNNIHAERVRQITGTKKGIYNVGALGVEGILKTPLYTVRNFYKKFKFRIDIPYILLTVHPETVDYADNKTNIRELVEALKQIPLPVLCTLPNADTEGNILREKLLDHEKKHPGKMKCIETLGQAGYYTAMKNCAFMLGNTSSGIIEAGSFRKYVINLGDRQKGRVAGKNVVNIPFKTKKIVEAAKKVSAAGWDRGIKNPYGAGNASEQIIKIIKHP